MSGQQKGKRVPSTRAVGGGLLALALVTAVACTDDDGEIDGAMAEFCAIAAEPADDGRWDDADAIVFFEPDVDPAESTVLALLNEDANVELLEVVDAEAAVGEIEAYFWDRPELAEALLGSGRVPLSVRIRRIDDGTPLSAEIDDHDDVTTVQYPDPDELGLVWGDVLTAMDDAEVLLRAVLHQPGVAGTLERWRDAEPGDLADDLDLLIGEARRVAPHSEALEEEHRLAISSVAATYRSECNPPD